MTRRLTDYEAIVEAGGIPPTGDKEKVILLRQTGEEEFTPRLVNIKNFERGQTETVYLVPGDTIIVPKRGFSFKNPDDILRALSPFGMARGSVPGFR
jgi:protein involved in polysaccharide export with SLBB domain